MNNYRINKPLSEIAQLAIFHTAKTIFNALQITANVMDKVMPTVLNIIGYGLLLTLMISAYFVVGTILHTAFLALLPFLIVCGKICILLALSFAALHYMNTRSLNGFAI